MTGEWKKGFQMHDKVTVKMVRGAGQINISPICLEAGGKKTGAFSAFIDEIQRIKKLQKRPDGIFGSYMTRPVSHIAAWFAYKLNISPNMVTLGSFVFCVMAGLPLILLQGDGYYPLAVSAALWWTGAILDAADGDLARFTGQTSDFGKWLDSFLDRIKEFIIFSLLAYLAWKADNDFIYIAAGFLSIFSSVMSGYISDMKYLFVNTRSPEIVLNKKYIFGMVDTRDFFVILSLLLNEARIALIAYSTVFLAAFIAQTFLFVRKYR